MLEEALKVLVFVGLIVLIIALIVLCIKLIGTLTKIDYLVDNVTKKAESLDGLFNVIEMTTNRFGAIGEALTSSMMGLLRKVFNKTDVNNYLAILLGIVIIELLKLVPFIGALVSIITLCLGLGIIKKILFSKKEVK